VTGVDTNVRVFLPQFGLLAGPLCAWGLWAASGSRLHARTSG